MNRYSSKAWKVLESLQNNYYPNQDILSITGFMGEEEFVQYVNNKLTSCAESDLESYLLEIGEK